MQNVVSIAAIQGIVARAAQISFASGRHRSGIGSRHRRDQVDDRTGVRDVVGRHQLLQVQARAVPERDDFDLREVVRPVLDRYTVVQVVEGGVRVVRVLQRDLQVPVHHPELDVRNADLAVQIQHVAGSRLRGLSVGKVLVPNRVPTVAPAERIKVIARAALQRIVARAAPEHVVADAAQKRVIPVTARQDIVPVAAGHDVVRAAPDQPVVASAAQISAASGRHRARISRRHRRDQIHGRAANCDIVGRHQFLQVQARAVPERNRLDLREVVRPVPDRHTVRKVVERRIRVVGVLERNLQTVGGQADQDVGDTDIAMQEQHVPGPGLLRLCGSCHGRPVIFGVGYAPRCIVTLALAAFIMPDPFGSVGRARAPLTPCPGNEMLVPDRVPAIAAAEAVEVVPGSALERVRARTAVQHVVAGVARQRVIACAAEQAVIGRAARDRVVPATAVDQHTRGAARAQCVAARAAEQHFEIVGRKVHRHACIALDEGDIRPGAAIDRAGREVVRIHEQDVVAVTAAQRVRPGAARQQVVAHAARQRVGAALAEHHHAVRPRGREGVGAAAAQDRLQTVRGEVRRHARLARHDRDVEARAAIDFSTREVVRVHNEDIAAGAAAQRVRAAVALKPVVTLAADQRVGAARTNKQATRRRRRQVVRRVVADDTRNPQNRRVQTPLRLRRRTGDMENRIVAAADRNVAVRILPDAPPGMLQRHIEEGLAALSVRVAALAEHRVARNRLLHTVARQRDRRDPRLRHRAKLARVALSVLVEVLPDPEPAPLRIVRIKNAVIVRVEMRQPLKVRLRPLHIGHERKLVMRRDRPVAVLVIGQEPVIRRRPRHALPVAVAVDVVKRCRIVQRNELHTVPVKVQHDRLARTAAAAKVVTPVEVLVLRRRSCGIVIGVIWPRRIVGVTASWRSWTAKGIIISVVGPIRIVGIAPEWTGWYAQVDRSDAIILIWFIRRIVQTQYTHTAVRICRRPISSIANPQFPGGSLNTPTSNGGSNSHGDNRSGCSHSDPHCSRNTHSDSGRNTQSRCQGVVRYNN